MPFTTVLAALAMAQINPSSSPGTVTQNDDFRSLFDRCALALRQRYYARVSRAQELEARLKATEVRATQAKNRTDFARIMNEMIAEFKDSHFEFLDNDTQGYYLMDGLGNRDAKPMPHLGAWFKPTAEGYTVTMVLQGGEAERAGLRKGDLMLRVDQQPFSPVAALRPRIGKETNVTFRRRSQEMQAKLMVKEAPALEMFLEATRKSARTFALENNKKIGYVHLWTQANDSFVTALHNIVLNQFRDTDAIILDLRDGFGGRPERYMDPFFRPEVEIEWKMGETGPTTKQLYGNQRPLVVLINKGSRSAKEVLAAIIKKSKRATLIGTTTAGDVLGTSPFRVADWAYLEIPMVDLTVDGERLERVGVSPDIRVEPEYSDSGEDRVMAEAIRVLKEKLGSARSSL